MLPEEAASSGYGKRSFGRLLLKHEGLLVGVFYLDSPEQDAFDDSINAAIEEASMRTGLTSSVAELSGPCASAAQHSRSLMPEPHIPQADRFDIQRLRDFGASENGIASTH